MQFGFCTQGILLMTAGFGTGGGGRCALMFLRMCVRALTACPCLRGLHVYFQYNGWAGVVLGEFSRGLNIGISKKKKKNPYRLHKGYRPLWSVVLNTLSTAVAIIR